MLDGLALCVVAKELVKPSLTIEVDDGHVTIRLQVLLNIGKVGCPVFEVMIGIAGEDEIDTVIR